MRGRDIKRYGYDFADKWLIATFPALHLDIDKYPAVKDFLEGFKPKLKQTGQPLKQKEIEQVIKHGRRNGIEINISELKKSRKITLNKWFETQDSIGYWEDFSKQKIMYSEIVQEPQFYFDKKGEFSPEATVFIITGENLESLYHLFHSQAVTFFFKTFYAGGGLGEGGYRYKKAFLENLPIPKTNTKIIFNKNNLNKLIYGLYDLTKKEIEFIESQ